MVEVDEYQVKYLTYYHYSKIINNTQLLLRFWIFNEELTFEELIKYLLEKIKELNKELEKLKDKNKTP